MIQGQRLQTTVIHATLLLETIRELTKQGRQDQPQMSFCISQTKYSFPVCYLFTYCTKARKKSIPSVKIVGSPFENKHLKVVINQLICQHFVRKPSYSLRRWAVKTQHVRISFHFKNLSAKKTLLNKEAYSLKLLLNQVRCYL